MERALRTGMCAFATLICGTSIQAAEKKFEVYGFAQVDYIQDFKRSNPNWEDTLRPSRIATDDEEYGSDGQATLSVRQSRFGVQGNLPAGGKDLETKFEIDMFGVGPDEGQTTLRLRHAYGKWGNWLGGQTHSLYMDIDAFPNTIDYWGPNGIVFLRTPQIRYIFSEGSNFFAVALEKPSNDIDPGELRQLSPQFADAVQGDEKFPDITARYRMNRDWGHFHIGGIVRSIGFDTAGTKDNEPKDSITGYGLSLATNIKTGGRNYIAASTNYGKGVASYQNDGGTDLAPGGTLADPRAELVPLWGLSAYYNHFWNEKYSSAIGYARVQVDNTTLQADDAFHIGEYASINLLHTPYERVMIGGEVLWGSKTENDDSYGDDIRTQISFKYSFSSLD